MSKVVTVESVDMPDQPEVSVLLAVHNGARYLESAVRSIMAQTLRNIEIVVVDDCSTDESPDILAQLAAEDSRIRLLRTPRNLRLAGALNYGLDHVRAPYVARMDDDDYSFPERLAIQKAYLDAHPDITLLGSSIEWMDAEGGFMRRSIRSRDSEAVRWSARFSLNVSHPTFMFRRHFPDGTMLQYDTQLHLSEDYELICRLLSAGGKVVCLPDVLLRYRFHSQSVSRKKFRAQVAESRDVGEAFQKRELPADIVEAIGPLRACFFGLAEVTPERLKGCFSGARAMLAHDIATNPSRARWYRRQTTQFVVWALERGGASTRQILLGFLRYAPDLFPALVLRRMETKRLLPKIFDSEPSV
ncbi:glycosyltransferase family 2 protein [Qingshengfaniella alkalisoli]|uniref:Glycosyltransferase n=1 Tax=Qingshengfaniella alkalisoli TaxID=2599296 RepID=A0A5B8I9J1_9RHOB|nr:glycosyltransferase [Qingshengfaniella alkalisoli]QDY70955.1 glycosyltransferase [Qingshengfaniella alkalisoli]